MRAIRVLMVAVGAGLGVFYPFVSVLLRDRGFDAAVIGLVFAVSAIAFTVAVPFWGHLADVRLGRARALVVCAVGAAVSILALLAPLPALAVAACIVVYSFFESSWQPLADALTINAVPDQGRDYARIRVLASVAFAVASIAAGQVYTQTGYGSATILFAVCAGIMAAAALRAPDVERADLAAHEVQATAPGSETASTGAGGATGAGGSIRAERPAGWRLGSTGVALRVAPRLAVVMLAVGLVHIGIIGGFTFLPLRITDLGGSAGDVALLAGLSAAAEIPAMLVAGRVALRIGLRGMFVGSALLYALSMASWVMLDTPLLLLATRMVTGVAFAGLVVSTVLTIGTLLPATLQATGQSLYQTVAFGLASIVANALGGLIYGSLGHGAFFALGAALAFVAAAVGWFAVPGRAGPAAPLGTGAVPPLAT